MTVIPPRRQRGLALFSAVLMVFCLLGFIGVRSVNGESPYAFRVARVYYEGDVMWTMYIQFIPCFSGDPERVADSVATDYGFRFLNPELAASYALGSPWLKLKMPLPFLSNQGVSPLTANPINGVLQPLLIGDSLQRTSETWNAVPDQWFRFQSAGITNAGTSSCSQVIDSFNVIRFATLAPGVLGVTCVTSRISAIGATPFEFDMEIANGVKWSTSLPVSPDAYDLDTTVLHELGHALGLDHSSVPSAVMYPSVASGVPRRVLAADDIAGLRALYGTAAAATPSPTPTPTAPPSSTPSAPPPTQQNLTVIPNGAYQEGANAVVVQDSGNVTTVALMVKAVSGRDVLAIWMLSSGRWRYFLPALPNVDGGLSGFPGPVASAIIILG